MTKQYIAEDLRGRLRRPRDDNQPSQYQKGYTEFYKLKFLVTPDVLIPRSETELLVDEVISFLASQGHALQGYQPLTILDIGTGSGNIAISIAKNLPTLSARAVSEVESVGTRVIATDISEKALKVAKQNAKLHGVEKQIKFIHSNLLSDILIHQHTDTLIIVTNLPYIPSARISHLDSSVKDFEPWIALDGGEDGFELYRKLFQQISKFSLTPLRWMPKLIIGEIDYTHGELAIKEAQKYFPEAIVEVKTDLSHKQRILLINH